MHTTPRKRWFKARDYGWGWTPTSIEGWGITFLYSIAFATVTIFYVSWLGVATEADAVDYRGLSLGTLEFLTTFALLVYTLTRICIRFGEKPSWRWGKK